MPHWFDPIEQLLSFWSLCRKPLESIGQDLVCLLTWLWLSSSENPKTGDRCAALQGLKGISEGGKNSCLFAYCKLQQTLGTRSGKYQRSVCLPHYLFSVSHSNQMLNFLTEIISCNSWQEGPKKGTPGLIIATYVVFRSMQNRNAFLLL